ncbi:Trk-type K+ transport system membrane component [Pseudoglutamicibacter albus]|uniref:Trk-type K+ transport system membrane component n=1 Tax=Pseudoglutamicibacter albus TaxID=98671 RepID=A0ABU1Z384_9MICC|nr:potassium transporter TrkG [Pseudoglutamicibacter albus]MDR7294216.1 Trk-type K+ transport system membrane component [Pseudoglutamicibacter albus]
MTPRYIRNPQDGQHNVLLRGMQQARNHTNRLIASSPARLTILVFAVGIAFFTTLLSLPIASRTGEPTPLADAMFTAVSAFCVTGLTTVSTAGHWTFFGQLVMIIAVFVGGLGIMTLASMLSMAVSRKLGVRGKLMAQTAMSQTASSKLGEVGSLLRVVITTAVSIQFVIALCLTIRFWVRGEDFSRGLWHGIFYAVSAFNNAGFTAHVDDLANFSHDLWILLPLMIAVFTGALGFPVMLVLVRHHFHAHKWNLHTKLTVTTALILLVVGWVIWGGIEWNNKATIGDLPVGDKIIYALFASIMTRSGGMALVNQTDLHPATMVVTDALMFIGGGSASTAGGIKLTTFAILFLAILAEARGTEHVHVYGRRLPEAALRIAIAVTALAASIITLGITLILFAKPDAPLEHVLLESISAFATVGLSTNLSAELPDFGKYVLCGLMFTGRLGTVTFATALTLRQSRQLYQLPEERPIIG